MAVFLESECYDNGHTREKITANNKVLKAFFVPWETQRKLICYLALSRLRPHFLSFSSTRPETRSVKVQFQLAFFFNLPFQIRKVGCQSVSTPTGYGPTLSRPPAWLQQKARTCIERARVHKSLSYKAHSRVVIQSVD